MKITSDGQMDKSTEIIVDRWYKILEKEHGTILCIFNSKNERDMYAMKINDLIATDKGSKRNLTCYKEKEYCCYYKVCNLTSCIGIGGVDYIIYVDCCSLDNFETVVSSYMPVLYGSGKTIIIGNNIAEKYKNINFFEIYENN